ncbi:hypothetical protein RB195_022529 [Necator americanus]|uniref:Uncharacterized protein n=1 Tax=Necator americanus TaxID=51031 RepID=A0ABR1EFK7_NECAM
MPVISKYFVLDPQVTELLRHTRALTIRKRSADSSLFLNKERQMQYIFAETVVQLEIGHICTCTSIASIYGSVVNLANLICDIDYNVFYGLFFVGDDLDQNSFLDLFES